LKKLITLFEQCLALFPDNWPSYLLMGKSYQALGDTDNALSFMMKAWDMDPENASVLKEIGITAGQAGRHDLVIQILAPLCEKGSDDGGLYVNYGLSLLMNQDSFSAVDQFGRACELEPDNDANPKLKRLAQPVTEGQMSCPKTEAEVVNGIQQVDG
jgi:Flp pilus assembly protein TadD